MSNLGKIYIDIESLLDLRQGTLNYLTEDIETVLNLINSDKYNFREIDDFSDLVPIDEFKKIYNNPPLDIIGMSTITYLVNVLKSKIDNLEKRNVFYNEQKKPEIVLNLHPFKLSKEQQDIFVDMFFTKLDTETFISVIYLPIKDISPYFIQSNNFISCFIYNVSEWLDCHLDALRKLKLHDNLIYFPSIYSKKGTEEEIKYIEQLGFKDIFGYLEFLLSDVASINFLPVLFYTNIISATVMIEKYGDK